MSIYIRIFHYDAEMVGLMIVCHDAYFMEFKI